MTEKGKGISQPVRITMAMVLWALILWFLSLGNPALAQLARAVFIIFVIPTGLVEWFKYKGIIGDKRSGLIKVLGMAGAAVLWYFEYR
ncbi:hypothetical protein SAMN05660649_01072 [Desulfotomaculum arcticum]|uniref:EamA domain-containing protein n=1 Tax=Desulfotruncus arcticus DSM 17038 TaxID=1121424 RepID=A0A1I2Q725_9FIRM|nr:hypothetical protein [Desulfotruncus arcticus]SFG23453.1 hypothetical protein SAMN05660649_01072 [Desulfotomaculum arcticum] [Desulfotruncus arcticus DSM 17038]